MHTSSMRMTLAALLLLAATPTAAQQAKQPASPPAPAPGWAGEVRWAWLDLADKVNTMAADFPEDKYDFKPSPEVRSFAEQVLHIGGGNYLFLKMVQGQPWTPAEGGPPRAKYKTKAEVVAYVRKSFDDVLAYVQSQGDAGMAREMKYPFGNRMTTQAAFLMDTSSHGAEHYGQLVVYYRLNKLVPPRSRQ